MSFFTNSITETDRYGNSRTRIKPRVGRIIVCCILAVLLLIAAFSSFSVIPSGYTGVKTIFGQISPDPVLPGFVMKVPFVQSIQKVNNKQQEQNFAKSEAKKTAYIWGESSERTAVYMSDVTVVYRINPEYSAWIYANVSDYKNNALPETLVASALKSAAVQLQSDDVTNRARIEPLAVTMLQKALDEKYGGNRVVEIFNISIGQMDFEDSYNAAIANKQVSQIAYEQQRIKNQQEIEAANAEAQKTKIAAEAEAARKLIAADAAAEEQRIAAKAEADAIKAVADAQAEANRKLSQSVTDTLIEYEKVQQWNGQLPTVTGTDTAIISIAE